MGTKTISLSEDAYERLEAAKREDESFSDVVRRLTEGVDLLSSFGVLSEGTADDLETAIAEARSRNRDRRVDRMDALVEQLDDS